MYSSRRRSGARQIALAAATLAALACSRRPAPAGGERLAILPVVNLTSDPGLDWVRAAAPALWEQALGGDGATFVFDAPFESEAWRAHATRTFEGYLTETAGTLEFHGVVRDLAGGVTLRAIVASANGAEGVAGLLNGVARRLSAAARPIPSARAGALRLYGEALQAGDPEREAERLRQAIAADAEFLPAYLAGASLQLASGKGGAAAETLAAARAQVHHAGPEDLAQIDYLAALAAGDNRKAIDSLERLSRYRPRNADYAAALAARQNLAGDAAGAVRSYRAALELEPWNAAWMNLMGYAQAWAGDLGGAKRTLAGYAKLANPGDVNPLDSLGEVSFLSGDFAAAEAYYLEAHRKNPMQFAGEDALRAAEARYMTGDAAKAGELFHAYAEWMRAHGEAGEAAIRQAQWDYLSGQRGHAVAALEAAAAGMQGNQAAYALSQLAFWRLARGDRAEAARLSARASGLASAPGPKIGAALTAFLAQPPAGAGEWSARASKEFAAAPPAVRETALAYALVLSGEFAAALPALTRLVEGSDANTGGGQRILLAWALLETGDAARAAALLRFAPLPFAAGDPIFLPLIYPRWFELKARVLEKSGKAGEAAAERRIYARYSS